MTVQELFQNEDCWIKGVPRIVDRSGAVRYCLIGAIYEVYNDHAIPNQNYNLALKAIEKLFPDRFTGTIQAFNDHKETTINDIRKVVKEANNIL